MSTISVIVPIYKVETYICRCVDSILAQTFSDFELILVDDGSPDNCGAICDEYAEKDVRVHVIHQENGGLSAARNAGIDWVFANSNSNWITFIDGDDWVLPIYLEVLYDAAQKYNVQISMCRLYRSVGETPEIDAMQVQPELKTAEDAYTLDGTCISAHAPARLYSRALFEGIRFPEGKLFEDVFTTHKICYSQAKMAVIEKGLYCYYTNSEGIVLSPKTLRRIKDEFDAFEAQIAFFSENGFNKSESLRIRGYLTGISDLLKELKQDREKNAEMILLLEEKKRKNFRKYAKRLDIKNETDAWVLTQVFPGKMKIYWKGKALIRKIKRLVS